MQAVNEPFLLEVYKNNQRSCLSQLHLDNALRICLETREPSDFPFEQLFHYIKNFVQTNVMFLILNSIGIADNIVSLALALA